MLATSNLCIKSEVRTTLKLRLCSSCCRVDWDAAADDNQAGVSNQPSLIIQLLGVPIRVHTMVRLGFKRSLSICPGVFAHLPD